MRQVSITSTLLSCIQSFSRSIDRSIAGGGREKTMFAGWGLTAAE